MNSDMAQQYEYDAAAAAAAAGYLQTEEDLYQQTDPDQEGLGANEMNVGDDADDLQSAHESGMDGNDDVMEEEMEQNGQDEGDNSGAFANVGQGLTGQYKRMMMQYWQETITSIEREDHDFKNHQLPLARIKKVMKTDEAVRMISAEAPILFAKGCDIFITELTMRAWIHAEENKRRTLQKSDIAAALQKSDMFDFLIDIVPRDEEKPKRHSAGNVNSVYNPTSLFYNDMGAAAAAAAAAANSADGNPNLAQLSNAGNLPKPELNYTQSKYNSVLQQFNANPNSAVTGSLGSLASQSRPQPHQQSSQLRIQIVQQPPNTLVEQDQQKKQQHHQEPQLHHQQQHQQQEQQQPQDTQQASRGTQLDLTQQSLEQSQMLSQQQQPARHTQLDLNGLDKQDTANNGSLAELDDSSYLDQQYYQQANVPSVHPQASSLQNNGATSVTGAYGDLNEYGF